MFPERFLGGGVGGGQGVGFAAGLARHDFRPFTAIYSTFLQRGYDQILHDVCLQRLPVVFCLDRAGLVGEDGPTHHGAFDIAYLRHIPNLVFMAPRDPLELKDMVEFCLSQPGPCAIRYPKGGASLTETRTAAIRLGKAEVMKNGKDLAIIAIGSMAGTALDIASLLERDRLSAMVVNARFINPLDEELLEGIAHDIKRIATLEDGVVKGGCGSAVLEFLERRKFGDIKIRRFGLPDRFIEHGKRSELFSKYNLTPSAIYDVIIKEMM